MKRKSLAHQEKRVHSNFSAYLYAIMLAITVIVIFFKIKYKAKSRQNYQEVESFIEILKAKANPIWGPGYYDIQPVAVKHSSTDQVTNTRNSPEHVSYHNLPAIIFYKTHKTGSSAVQNILYRLAYNENLTIGWPKAKKKGDTSDRGKASTSLFYPYRFERDFMLNQEKSVDVLCNHVAYSDELLDFMNTKTKGDQIKPRKIFRFTILREAFSLLKSTFNYYRDYENSCMHNPKTLASFIRGHYWYTTGKKTLIFVVIIENITYAYRCKYFKIKKAHKYIDLKWPDQ